MFGPVFNRAFITLPRRSRHFIHRTAYAAGLFILLCTAWQVLAGTQVIRNTGDFARFGAMAFQLLAPLQLALAMFAAALLSAASISAEKDRRTLDLLLLTDLTNSQFVLGKLFGSLLLIWAPLLAALPIFALAILFGGISPGQVGRGLAVTLATTLLAGSLGTTLALWRDKTFQTLAITAIVIVFWLVFWEVVGAGALGTHWVDIETQKWAIAFSPWQAILAATQPIEQTVSESFRVGDGVTLFIPTALAISAALATWGTLRFRVWNPHQETDRGRIPAEEEGHAQIDPSARARMHDAPGKARTVWSNPILWREIRTWAYGRKVLLVRAAYLVLCVLAAAMLYGLAQGDDGLTRIGAATALVPLFVLGLVLVNAQAVTSITTERDGKALDLLLVTDLSPREFIFGKLAGVLYNTKEMILVPIALCAALWFAGALSLENLIYLVGGSLVLYIFVAMLGVHIGLSYGSSPTAIAISLGTVFFLFVGIATGMRVIVAFSGSFQVQLQPFLAFMVGGGVGLFLALGARNPSTAILAASLLCPFVTFYAITSFLLGQTLNVFLVTSAMYAFATAAMLIPALHEFDVATRRPGAADE